MEMDRPILSTPQKIEIIAYASQKYLQAVRMGSFRSAIQYAEYIHRLTLIFAIQEEREEIGIPIITWPGPSGDDG